MEADSDSQGPPSKKSRTVRGNCSVAGQVNSVSLVNFMCHENLSIDFNTKENNCFYIGGKNGSGKSALFAAIQLGVGARSLDNGRADNLKSYIKDGKQQAIVNIFLSNEGHNFHPKFNQEIRIERTIRPYSSQYKVFNVTISSTGAKKYEERSNKKEYVDLIAKYFNIAVDNPVFWMTQDRCREYLASSDPKKLYNLYLQATNLDGIQLVLSRFPLSVAGSEDILVEKQSQLESQKQNLVRMKKKQERQDQKEELNEKIKVCKLKLDYREYLDRVEKVKINQRKEEICTEEFQKAKEEYAENRTKRANHFEKFEPLENEMKVFDEDITEVKKKKDEADVAEKELIQNRHELTAEIQRHQRAISQNKQNIEKSRKLYQKTLHDIGYPKMSEELEELERKIASLIEERLVTEKKIAENDQKIKTWAAELVTAKTNLNSASDRVKGIDNIFNYLQQLSLRQLEAEQKSVNRFGDKMDSILQHIESNTSFDKPPKGPIGNFIKLQDPKWTLPVEVCFNAIMSSFLCHSQNDAIHLRGIFRKILGAENEDHPPVIVSKFTRKKYSPLLEPDAHFPTVLRMIEVSDPDVHNSLIDGTGCEQIVLIEKKEDAMKMMREGNVHKNVIFAYTLEGSRVYPGGEGNRYRYYAEQKHHLVGFFAKPVTYGKARVTPEKLRKAEEEKSKRQADHSKWESTVRELKCNLKKSKNKEELLEREMMNLRLQSADVENKHRSVELKTKYMDTNCETLEDLNVTIEVCEQTIEEKRIALTAAEAKLKKNDEELSDASKKLKEATQDLKDLISDSKDLVEKLADLKSILDNFDLDVQPLKNRLDRAKDEKEKVIREEQRLKCEADEALKIYEHNRESIFPGAQRDEPDMSDVPDMETGKDLIKKLEATLAIIDRDCDKRITEDNLKEVEQDIAKLELLQGRMKEELVDMKKIHINRCKTIPSLRAGTEMKIKEKFKELLEIRGHLDGCLDFDHDTKTINVVVKSSIDQDVMLNKDQSTSDVEPPLKKKRLSQYRSDLKGLSGGERSFVTAALIMSFWQVMDQPFRIIDEIDVFMDNLNRKLAMDLFVEMATKTFPHNQFICFTPQGIKELTRVEGLQVLEIEKRE